MSKRSKERLCYVHNIDTFNPMSKGSKDYVMDTRVERLHYVETRDIYIFAHNFLYTQPIFNLKKVLES